MRPSLETGVLAACGAALLGLYLAFPEKVFVFDGIMFAGVIERSVDEWRAELFNGRHLLFNPFFMLLRDALGLAGIKVGAYALVQRVNALFGVLGALLFYRLCARLSRDRGAAAVLTALLAVSYSYWSRATEGQVYMIMTFSALCCAAACCAYVLAPSAARAGLVALTLSAATLFHTINAALFPMALGALALAERRRRGRDLWAWAGAGAVTVSSFAWAFGIDTPMKALEFFTRTTGFYERGQGESWLSLARRFLSWDQGGLPAKLLLTGREFSGALASGASAAPASWAAAFLLWGALWTLLARAWPRLDRPGRLCSAALLYWAGVYEAVNALWGGGEFFVAGPVAAALALAGLAWPSLSLSAKARGAVLGLGVGAAIALEAWNLARGVIPNGRIENNAGYRQALFVRDHTFPSSWIVISGLGLSNAKVYLPHFAGRSREVLEYYLDRNAKPEALRQFSEFVRRQLTVGVPLYLLSDLVEDGPVLRQIQERWGVSPGELRACFGSGELYRVAEQDGLRIYLFLPAASPESFFAGLTYSILSESDTTRIVESVGALKRVGAKMTKAQRDNTVALLKSSRYGGDLVYAGFLPYMSPESRKRGAERVERFARQAESGPPDFYLRLGNLYRYLGREDETLKVWRRAYQLSSDPGLAADIKNIEKSLKIR